MIAFTLERMADEILPRALSLAVHELRTPVTVAAGYLRMLLKEQAGPITDKQRKMLEEAERACGRITAVVAEMSDMGKLESRQLSVGRSAVNLAELVAGLASTMQEGRDRGVHLEITGIENAVTVLGDRARLSAALGGLTHASLRERGQPGTVVAALTKVTGTPTPWAVFAVGDPSAIPGLVEQARTGAITDFDEWRGGLGLALPVLRRVIESLDGAVWSANGDQAKAGSALRLPLHE